MHKLFVLLLALIGISIQTYAQFETDNEPYTTTTNTEGITRSNPSKTEWVLKDELVVGGGLDLMFGNITTVGISPMVGSWLFDRFFLGVTVSYRYVNYKYIQPPLEFSTWGVAPFVRFDIYSGFFTHVEYEALYGKWDYRDNPFWITSFFVGGGYNVSVGNKGFMGIYMLWNLTKDPNYEIYKNPVFRMSFGLGLN